MSDDPLSNSSQPNPIPTPVSIDYARKIRPPALSLYRRYLAMGVNATGVLFGAIFTVAGFAFALNQWFGDEPADTGAPCAMFLPVIGPWMLFQCLHGIWMTERMKNGRRVYDFWTSLRRIRRLGWRDFDIEER